MPRQPAQLRISFRSVDRGPPSGGIPTSIDVYSPFDASRHLCYTAHQLVWGMRMAGRLISSRLRDCLDELVPPQPAELHTMEDYARAKNFPIQSRFRS